MAPQHQIPTDIFEQLTAAELECKTHRCLNGTTSKTREVWDEQRAAGADLTQFKNLRAHFEAPPESPPESPTIDGEQVSRFFQLLNKDPAKARVRGFAHKSNPNKEKIEARKGSLNVDNLKPQEKWQSEGRGLYVVINDGGDSKDKITSCPANYFELDGLTKQQQLDRIGRIPELNDFIGMTVATREGDEGSLHTYFLLEEPQTDVLRWRLMQWRLIQLYKSDAKVEDPSRVMRLPGAWYVLGDGSFHSRSLIVEERTSGKRVSFEALEKAVGKAEEIRNLSPAEAVPSARWNDNDVLEMMQRLFAKETAKKTAAKEQPFADFRSGAGQSAKPWHTNHTLDEIKEALAIMPPRKPGLNTYEEDRKVLSGLASALVEVGLDRGHALSLIEEAGWTGWNAEQVLNSSWELGSATFWAHARKCGWKSKEEKAKEAERIKQEVAETHLTENILALIDAGVAGNELIEAQFALSANVGTSLAQIQKLFSEILQNERGTERMEEALNLITAAQEDDLISVRDLVPEKFYREVIEDFQKGIEVDELVILMLVLTTMSSVLPIGTKVRLLDFTSHDQAVLIYFLILTVSGGKKTLLFDELVEKPLMGSEVAERMKQRYARTQKYQRDAKKNRDSKTNDEPEDETSAESMLASRVAIKPLRHVVSDFTGEGLDRNCQQAADHYQHGFLIGTDEGRQLLAGDQYKGSNSTYTTDKLTRLYDGKGGNQVRGDQKNERHYTESHVAIAALVQPEIYDQIAAQQADDESGFWPRFQTVESEPARIRRATKEERKNAKQKTYPDALKALYGAANYIGECQHREVLGKQPHFRFSEEAQDWWYERAMEIEDEQLDQAKNGDPMVARVLGKAQGQVGRLAALLHLLNELVEKGDVRTPSVEISLATVEKAFRLQARLMRRTIKQRLRATGEGATNDTKLLQEIQIRCLNKDPEGDGLKLGAIERFWNQHNRPTKEYLFHAISALAADGWGSIKKSTSNRGGWIYTALKVLPS